MDSHDDRARDPRSAPLEREAHGAAIGAGCCVALACDIRASTASAQLGLPAVNEGLIPGLATYRLPHYIGMGRAKQMILSGDSITGQQALNIGLIDHLLSEKRMAEELEQLIGKYLQSNNEGCRFSKAMLVECFDLDFDRFRGRYMDLQSEAMNSDDFHEAMAAYREKRTPGRK